MNILQDPRLDIRFLPTLIIRTVKELGDDDATHMAAGVAYYALFSIFPLLLGVIAIIGIASQSSSTRRRILEWTSENFPGAGELISDNIVASIETSGSLGAISIVGLIWAGSAIFGAITRTINRAWDIHEDRPFIKNKIMQLTMAVGVAILFGIAVASASLAQASGRLSDSEAFLVGHADKASGLALFRILSFIANLAIFLTLYKVLPNTKTHWRYIWPGALVAALLFEGGKYLFVFYLDNFATLSAVYGSIGSVIVLLLWAYVSAFIMILGAELSSEYGRMMHGVDRGLNTGRRTGTGRVF